MANKASFIVDADIARSAGLSVHPVSKGSRETLDGILKNEHEAKFCKTLLGEWKKHRSNYASTWFTSMFSKKCILIIEHKNQTKLLIQNSTLTENEKAIADKDSHVVDSALSGNSIIISNDITARAAFSNLATQHKSLSVLYWAHSVNNNTDLQNYMSNVSRPPSNWKL